MSGNQSKDTRVKQEGNHATEAIDVAGKELQKQ